MRITAHITTTASIAALISCLGFAPSIASAAEGADLAKGKELAFNRKKGNCLACHQIEGGTLAGNIGPPLIAMKARFPDYDKLRAQINDARTNNPNTIMIPFGPHAVMSGGEIDLVAKFIYTL
ncbi:MAG: sulfur oxidation c-type cytochrome SoxX [Gammaproteobacteria bacterium]|jgi:sulfur-oxidizing protein SoxX|nr:sulfur oxidation c-type cytochrome SoxX [Gammaproteobacteria bacterium]